MSQTPADEWADHFDWSVMSDDAGYDARAHGVGGGPTPAGVQPLEGRKKISDATIYGPRFCTIFEAFRNHINRPIDISRHLMALCAEYLAEFIKWARESEDQVKWIGELLLDNDYLRPEVRNGIVMVIIYTFASIKATLRDGLDMFVTLQDNDTGLGIANRFSLKIYNDPFNYLTFLKTSISALIDAGVIPDNERMNQPKKPKTLRQNADEYSAFLQLVHTLTGFLDKGNNTGAKNYVGHITSHWQLRGKFVRNRRFVSAVQSVASIPLSTFSNATTTASLGLASTALLQAIAPNLLGSSLAEGSTPDTGASANSSDSDGEHAARRKRRILGDPPARHPKGGAQATAISATSTESHVPAAHPPNSSAAPQIALSTAPLPTPAGQALSSILVLPPLPFLRFERVGRNEWDIKETHVFDLEAFFRNLSGPSNEPVLFFMDESRIRTEVQQLRLEGSQTRGLARELQDRRALVTTWPLRETQQCKYFLQRWQEENKARAPISLFALWRRLHSQAATDAVAGCLGYETAHTVGMVLRSNEKARLPEDLWCRIYVNELAPEMPQDTMADFLAGLFPQLLGLCAQLQRDRVAVKYAGLAASLADDALPSRQAATAYQTVGTLASPVGKVLGRMSPSACFHDLVLEVL